MARATTAGTSSCATIAIGGIKTRGANAAKDNEDYLADKKGYKLYESPRGEMTVDQFYSSVIFPTSQPLGETRDYPFDMLMDHIEDSSLKTKWMSLVLNQSQYNHDNHYWAKRAYARGFRLVEKTKNTLGSMNYVFVRSDNRKDLVEEDMQFTK